MATYNNQYYTLADLQARKDELQANIQKKRRTN